MKLLPAIIAGTALYGETEALRRGSRRKPNYQPITSGVNRSFDELPQGDDPFAGMRGPRPDYGPNSWARSQEECEPVEPPFCPPDEECTAGMKDQDCTCDCNEEPPPKCDLDVVVMIDVCSCSPEVWHGIKSYVDALVTKYDQEIGVSEDEVNVAIVAFSDTVKTIVPFGDPKSFDFEGLTDDVDGVIHNINISPFASQGTYIDKALEHVNNEVMKGARPNSKKVLVSLTDGYNHPSVRSETFNANVDAIVNQGVSIHAVARLPYTRSDECEEYGSVNRKKVCQARAHVLRKLNNDDEDIFIYSDARSTHDVIASSEEMCPAPSEKSLHCECTCDLPNGCPGGSGDRGVNGLDGEKGPEGPAGMDGETGQQGDCGPEGPQGERGPDGSPGVNGPRGEPGRDARHGQHGNRGNQGPVGDKGITGPPGPSGDTGLNGDTGMQGDQGEIGKDGMPGPPGKQGQPKMVNMGSLKNAVFAILDELKPGGQPLSEAELERILR